MPYNLHRGLNVCGGQGECVIKMVGKAIALRPMETCTTERLACTFAGVGLFVSLLHVALLGYWAFPSACRLSIYF